MKIKNLDWKQNKAKQNKKLENTKKSINGRFMRNFYCSKLSRDKDSIE